MLKIKHPNKEHEIKSQVEEFTIEEFENLVEMMNDPEKDTLDRWSNVFVYCGLDSEVLDDMDTFDFINLIKEFNIFNLDSEELQKSIVLDGIEYVAYDDAFKISVKEMRLIEGFIKKDPNKYIANVMAVLYKRSDIDKTMTFDSAHIKYKAGLIRKQITADVCIPIIKYLSKKLVKEVSVIDGAN